MDMAGLGAGIASIPIPAHLAATHQVPSSRLPTRLTALACPLSPWRPPYTWTWWNWTSWIETPPIKNPRRETGKKGTKFDPPIKKPRIETEEMLKEKRMKHIKILVREFSRAHSADRSNVLESWFWELGVNSVFQLDVGASARVHRQTTTDEICSWIRALIQILKTIHLTESFFPDHGHGFVGMPGISEEQVDSGKQDTTTSLEPVQFALFFQEAMAKMLVFVDILLSESSSIQDKLKQEVSIRHCLLIHSVLSKAIGIRFPFHSSRPAEIEKIEKEITRLSSAKQGKAFDAIWSFMEERRTRALKSMEDSLGDETLPGSSDIHQATCSVMDHIKFLRNNCDPLFISQAASLGKYVPQPGLKEAQPFVSMIAEMVSCLEEKLITKSQSFLDEGLGLLFLLNNSNFIREQIQDSPSYIEADLTAIISSITRKVEHYTESYIQVSWEPISACLFYLPLRRLVRMYSPLSKLESEFQKIYTTQKLWKVPDPKLRKRLRKTVIEEIIPGYTKYIKDSKVVTNPKFTPQELEEMLQELFEG